MEQIIELFPVESHEAGNYYPLVVIEEAIDEIEKRIAEDGGVVGEMGIPLPADDPARIGSIDYSRVSHVVQHVWIDNGMVMCKVRLLGKYSELREIMGVEFSGIPRAFGQIGDDGVCTKYTLITVDLGLPGGP